MMNNVSACVAGGAAILATSAASVGDAASWVQVGGTLAGSALLVWAIRHAYREVERAHKEVAETHEAMRMLCREVADKCAKCPLAESARRLANEANEQLLKRHEKDCD